MKIFITNLEAYNNGKLQGEWVTLPLDDFDNDFEAILKRIGSPEEYFITDYDCDYFKIDEYKNIKELNKLAEYYNDLDECDQAILEFYIDDQHVTCIDDIIDFDLDEIIFYAGMDLEEVARELVEDGYYGEVNPNFWGFIDFKAIARSLDLNGYTETDKGVFYYA